MRFAIAAACGMFLAATLAGCGGSVTTTPPAGAKPGPPPGTSGNLTKVQEPAKKK